MSARQKESIPAEKLLELVWDWEHSLDDKIEFLSPLPRERTLLVFTRRDRVFARNFDTAQASFRELRPLPFRPLLSVAYHPEASHAHESRILFLTPDRLFEASFAPATGGFSNIQERLDLKMLGLEDAQLVTRDREHFFISSRTAILKVSKKDGRLIHRWNAFRIAGEVHAFREIDLLKYDRGQHALLVGTRRQILKLDDEACEDGVAPFAEILESEDIYNEDPENRLKRRLVWAFEEAWEELLRDTATTVYFNPLRHKYLRLERKAQNLINSAHLISTVAHRSPSLGLLELERVFLVHNFRIQCLKVPSEALARLDAARERELSALLETDPCHPNHHTVFNRDNILRYLEREGVALLRACQAPRVLEIACGTGKNTYGCAMALLRAGFRTFTVAGCDQSAGVIELARQARYSRTARFELPLRFHPYLESDPEDPEVVRVVPAVAEHVRFLPGRLEDLEGMPEYDLCLYIGSIPEKEPERRARIVERIATRSRMVFFTDALAPQDRPAEHAPALQAFREVEAYGRLRGFVRKS